MKKIALILILFVVGLSVYSQPTFPSGLQDVTPGVNLVRKSTPYIMGAGGILIFILFGPKNKKKK